MLRDSCGHWVIPLGMYTLTQAVQERAADEGQFAAVHSLLTAYFGALDAAQPPLALLPPPTADDPSRGPHIVRGGPALGAVGPAARAEACAGGCAAPGCPAPTQVWGSTLLACAVHLVGVVCPQACVQLGSLAAPRSLGRRYHP